MLKIKRIFAYVFALSLIILVNSCDENTLNPVDETQPLIYNLNIKTLMVGQKFTLTGKNFGVTQGTSKVNMNGIDCVNYDLWNDSTIICTVPSGVTSGKLKVIKGQLESNSIDYTIQQSYSLVPMVLIPKGSFIMGNDKDDEWDNKPTHKVNITYDFYMSKYEITQEIWKVVYGSTSNPSRYTNDKYPVEQVSWFKAVEFCNELSKIEKLTPCYTISGTNITCNFNANGYRLPTEAEWEYACRAGTTGDYYGDIASIAWTNLNANNSPHNVGLKTPNAFDLYDMSGNVWEWCWDYYDTDYYSGSATDNPKGPNNGVERVLRGGSWIDGPIDAKSSKRNSSDPSLYNYKWGIRVVRNK